MKNLNNSPRGSVRVTDGSFPPVLEERVLNQGTRFFTGVVNPVETDIYPDRKVFSTENQLASGMPLQPVNPAVAGVVDGSESGFIETVNDLVAKEDKAQAVKAKEITNNSNE